MDPDFMREILVLAAFIGLYVFGSIALLRGHKTDLSAVHMHAKAGAVALAAGVKPRLNRRRKAIARDAGVLATPPTVQTQDESDDDDQ